VVTNPQESMEIEPNTDNTAEKSEPINMSTYQKNLDNDPKAIDKNKPTLTNEDLINFKNSISYVSKILSIFQPFIFFCMYFTIANSLFPHLYNR